MTFAVPAAFMEAKGVSDKSCRRATKHSFHHTLSHEEKKKASLRRRIRAAATPSRLRQPMINHK